MSGQRNIALWYLLTIVTLGIGGLVWYYKINADAKRLAGNKAWSPGLSVLAVTLGAFVVVPAIVSYWRTWSRVREATGADGLSAGLQFCLIFIPIVSIAYMGYLQSKINQSIGAAIAVPAPPEGFDHRVEDRVPRASRKHANPFAFRGEVPGSLIQSKPWRTARASKPWRTARAH